MALNRVDLGIQYFPQFAADRAIANAQIYIGQPNLDPAVLANQIQAYVVQENGTQVAVPQPIRTGAGGVPIYNGSPVQIGVSEAQYSLKVLTSTGSQIYYQPDNTDLAIVNAAQVTYNPAGAGAVATTVGAELDDINSQLENIEGNLNFTTLPSAMTPVADTDLLLLRQGSENKKLTVSVIRSEFATDAEAAAVRAEAAESGAEAARDAALLSKGLWPTTAAGIGNGIAGATITSGGSGGTDGTFALAFSGGTQVLEPAGVFTVVGGAVVSVTMTYPGYYSSGTPTFSFAASAGLTGVNITPVMAANTSVDEYFSVPVEGSDDILILYKVNAGPVAAEVGRYPSSLVVEDLRLRSLGTLVRSYQLFDKNASGNADNFFVRNSDGNLQANADYLATDFIPVTAGLTYFLNQKSFLAWYNASKVYISGSSNTDTNRFQTAPAGAAFLRTSIYFLNTGFTVDNFMVAQSTVELPYVTFGGQVLASGLEPIGEAQIQDDAVAPLKTNFLEKGKNLFNKATRTLDSIQGTAGVVVNTSFDLSDFIPVEEGVTYQYRSIAGGARFRACFDALGNNVTAQSSNAETLSYTVPIGSGVVSMRLSIAKERVDDFQVEEGDAPTSFEPFGFKFTELIIPFATTPFTSSSWLGQKFSSFGDSLTAQLEWQPQIASKLGLVHTAYGVGGRQICGATGMCQDAAIDTIPADSQLVLVLGGTNDWAQSRVLGATNSTNTEEFYGALNQMCQKLTTRLPTARICILTTPYGELPGRLTDGTGWTTPETNLAGLTTRAYAEAIRVAGKRWGFPVIDLDECGWNEINLLTYMKADGGSIHPNDAGGDRMAEVCIGRLKDLEPLA